MTLSTFLNAFVQRFRKSEAADERASAPAVVDGDWYKAAYPQAAHEIALGRTPQEHYERIGRHRGYLPRAGAGRPRFPDRPSSLFGGLWTDRANALDLVEGKLETGAIDERQAELLRQWIRDGYVVLRQALPGGLVDAARDELDRAYSGGFPRLIFDCVDQPPRLSTFLAHHREVPAKALDLHWESQATRDAIFAPAIVEFLCLIFERRPMATQTLGFLRGSAQAPHQDSAYVSYTNSMHFAASWIALEDVTPGGGELFYYPGSHKLPDYLYFGEHKNIIDAQRCSPEGDIAGAIADHVNVLPGRCRSMGFERQRFMARAGDALIWSADVVHGGSPISQEATRRSVVTHYCPKEVAPLFFEDKPREIRFHESGNPYTTSAY